MVWYCMCTGSRQLEVCKGVEDECHVMCRCVCHGAGLLCENHLALANATHAFL